ncbi:MAG: hypothetical protein JWM11_513 [Planctomycetaceae bacterium]|nr:hypothetical protein [Planctomycetaceae bacterium]
MISLTNRIIGLLALGLTSFAGQLSLLAQGPAENPPHYKVLRYDEDYSYLNDVFQQTDQWDAIKYIPIGNCDNTYLSIGGEARERYEFYHDEDFGDAPASSKGNNGYLLQRYLLHGDLHIGPHFRYFGQLMTGLEDGRIGGPHPDVDRDAFDLHQTFADFIAPLEGENDSITVRVGRQEMTYGSGRLIDVREGPNLRRSFDGAKILIRSGETSVDGWWSKPVRNRVGVFDDDPNPDKSFWGIYATRPAPILPEGNVDLYYLGFENRDAVYNQGSGYELRHSLGTRLWGNPVPWEYNLEYIWQFGTFGAGNINAWSAAHAVRYNFYDTPLKPRFGIRADIASGDNNPNSRNLQTFNPLFPSGVYFNLANPVGPSNMIDLHPVLDLHFGEQVTVTTDWDFFWRESLNDGAYRLSGSLLRPAGGSDARFVGNSPSVTLIWSATRHLSFVASYVHFFPGQFLKDNTLPSQPIDFFTTWIDYKF